MTVAVQTLVNPEVAKRLAERASLHGDTTSAYMRRLILADLGLVKLGNAPADQEPTS